MAKLREATTPPLVELLTEAVTAHVEAASRSHGERLGVLQMDLRARESEAANLGAALKAGRQSLAILAELETVEVAIAALRAQLVALGQVGAPIRPAVHPEWVRARLTQLETLLRDDPIRARTEIMKHLEGDLTVTPLPADAGQQRVEISGVAKPNSLLAGEEAAFVRLVAGAR